MKELDKIKEKQLAVHFDDAHIVGVGAPIYKNGKIIASLGVYLPGVRFNYTFQELVFSEVKKVAKQISEKIDMLQSN